MMTEQMWELGGMEDEQMMTAMMMISEESDTVMTHSHTITHHPPTVQMTGSLLLRSWATTHQAPLRSVPAF